MTKKPEMPHNRATLREPEARLADLARLRAVRAPAATHAHRGSATRLVVWLGG